MTPPALEDELLQVAADCLLMGGTSGYKRDVVLWALGEIVSEVRERHREKDEATREELAARLDHIQGTASALKQAMAGPGALDALEYGWPTPSVSDDPDSLTVDDLSLHLTNVAKAAGNAIEWLGLRGRKGSVGPLAEARIPAKVLLAFYGASLFKEVRGLERGPGHNDKNLHTALDMMWEAATGESAQSGNHNWSRAIRTGRSKASISGKEPARICMRRDAEELIMKFRKRQEGRHSLKKPGLMAPR